MTINLTASINWEMIIGISGVIIALCALFATFWQMREARRHNRFSVKPILNIEISPDYQQSSVKLSITNDGIGPAIIKSIAINYPNLEFPHPNDTLQWQQFIESLLNEMGFHSGLEASGYFLGEDSTLLPERKEVLIRIHLAENNDNKQKFVLLMKEIDRLRIIVNFESLYGEPMSIYRIRKLSNI